MKPVLIDPKRLIETLFMEVGKVVERDIHVRADFVKMIVADVEAILRPLRDVAMYFMLTGNFPRANAEVTIEENFLVVNLDGQNAPALGQATGKVAEDETLPNFRQAIQGMGGNLKWATKGKKSSMEMRVPVSVQAAE